MSSLSLKAIIPVILLPFLILILVCCAAFYLSSTSKYTSLLKSNAQSLVQQTQSSLDKDLNNIKILSKSLTASPSFATMGSNISVDKTAILPADYLQLSNLFTNFVQQNSTHISSVGLFLSDYSICYYSSSFHTDAAARIHFRYSDYAEYADRFDWLYNSQKFPYHWVTSKPSTFSLFQVFGTENTKVNGFFFVEIRDDLFLDQIKNCRLTKSSCMTLVRDDGEILFRDSGLLGSGTMKHMSRQEIDAVREHIHTANSGGLTTFQTDRYYVVYTPISIRGTGILAVIPLNEMLIDYKSFSDLLLILAAGTILVFIALYYIIVPRFFSHPIVSLLHQMNAITSPDMKNPIRVGGSREIVRISGGINALLTRINILSKSIEREMRAKQVTQLQYLFAQINPHFLYNALDCIKELCSCNRNEEAEKMVDQLAVFYRIGVSKGKSFISLHDELLHISMYLSILQTRFEDFRFTIEVPEGLEHCVVLRMILQPLVENAVYHGLRPCRTDGIVRVMVEREGRILKLHVKDNGAGIPENILENIQRSIHGPICDYSSRTFPAYGLKNVQDRLQIAYGKPYGIQIQTEVEKGSNVTVILPYEEEHT